MGPTVRGLVEGGKRANSTGSNEKLGHWNPDMVAELKINEVALTSSMKFDHRL
jgi:hypothetical protein